MSEPWLAAAHEAADHHRVSKHSKPRPRLHSHACPCQFHNGSFGPRKQNRTITDHCERPGDKAESLSTSALVMLNPKMFRSWKHTDTQRFAFFPSIFFIYF